MVFLGAVIAGVEYAEFVIAAVIPAFLYVYAMQIQIDGYAAKHGLKGLPRSECPPLLPILKEGWIYIVVIAFLAFGLIYMRWGAIVPVYAVILTVILQFATWAYRKLKLTLTGRRDEKMDLGPSTRRALHSAEHAFSHAAGLINFAVGVTFSMGFILVGLFKTGVAGAITSWIVSLGAGNAYLVLFIATAFSVVMGMVGLQRAAFLFLSVTAAPAIAKVLNVPVHIILLFIIYQAGYGTVTPPVAIDAYVAASIAGANPIKTSYVASRMLVPLLLVPFFFVFQPALAMQGPFFAWDGEPQGIIYHLIVAMVGIFIMVCGTGGYFTGLGSAKPWERAFFILGGFLIAFPELITTVIGLILAAIGIVLLLVRKATERRKNNVSPAVTGSG